VPDGREGVERHMTTQVAPEHVALGAQPADARAGRELGVGQSAGSAR